MLETQEPANGGLISILELVAQSAFLSPGSSSWSMAVRQMALVTIDSKVGVRG